MEWTIERRWTAATRHQRILVAELTRSRPRRSLCTESAAGGARCRQITSRGRGVMKMWGTRSGEARIGCVPRPPELERLTRFAARLSLSPPAHHMEAPPQSLQSDRRRPCSQTPVPPHLAQRLFTRPWGQMPLPWQGRHCERSRPWGHILDPPQYLQRLRTLSCSLEEGKKGQGGAGRFRDRSVGGGGGAQQSPLVLPSARS